jgi:hypothetical protein
MQRRSATAAEIAAHWATSIQYGFKVQFRHFVVETYSPTAKNGVHHRRYNKAKLQLRDGGVFVRHHNRTEKLTADVVTIGGREYVSDLRLDSPYL